MLCPECGEVVGPGPLDVRRALRCNHWQVEPVGPVRHLFEKLKQWFGNRPNEHPMSEDT